MPSASDATRMIAPIVQTVLVDTAPTFTPGTPAAILPTTVITNSRTLSRGDRGDALGAKFAEQGMGAVDQLRARGLVHRGERLDVSARAEQHRVGGGDHERAHTGLPDAAPHLLQILDDLRADRV